MTMTRILAAAAMLLLGVGSAGALTDAEKCHSSELKVAGKYSFCRLKAEAKAVKTASPPDYSKCDESFAAKFSQADAKGMGQCPASATQAEIQAYLTQCSDDVATALGGGTLPGCAGDLATCTASLGVCDASLDNCDTSLSTCTDSLTTVNAGTATAADVLNGATFSSVAGIGLAGTMTDNGAVSITPGTASQAIAAGYHNGAGTVTGDADLVAANIKSGVDIFGVTGSLSVLSSGLPETGQTTPYGAGSDGDLQRGAARSFTDNGDGTITDDVTGLMWEKKSMDGSIHDVGLTAPSWSAMATTTMSGTMVTTFLATLNGGGGFAGYTDWRIPNITELQSLLNYQTFNPATYAAFNAGCTPGCTVTTCSCTATYQYWSSTTQTGNAVNAWAVSFLQGMPAWVPKTGSLTVRAVRGGS